MLWIALLSLPVRFWPSPWATNLLSSVCVSYLLHGCHSSSSSWVASLLFALFSYLRQLSLKLTKTAIVFLSSSTSASFRPLNGISLTMILWPRPSNLALSVFSFHFGDFIRGLAPSVLNYALGQVFFLSDCVSLHFFTHTVRLQIWVVWGIWKNLMGSLDSFFVRFHSTFDCRDSNWTVVLFCLGGGKGVKEGVLNSIAAHFDLYRLSLIEDWLCIIALDFDRLLLFAFFSCTNKFDCHVLQINLELVLPGSDCLSHLLAFLHRTHNFNYSDQLLSGDFWSIVSLHLLCVFNRIDLFYFLSLIFAIDLTFRRTLICLCLRWFFVCIWFGWTSCVLSVHQNLAYLSWHTSNNKVDDNTHTRWLGTCVSQPDFVLALHAGWLIFVIGEVVFFLLLASDGRWFGLWAQSAPIVFIRLSFRLISDRFANCCSCRLFFGCNPIPACSATMVEKTAANGWSPQDKALLFLLLQDKSIIDRAHTHSHLVCLSASDWRPLFRQSSSCLIIDLVDPLLDLLAVSFLFFLDVDLPIGTHTRSQLIDGLIIRSLLCRS